MATVLSRVRSRENALFLGMIAAAIIVIGIAVFVFFAYTKTTESLNEPQRFRAVCEHLGGTKVEEYCIRGDEVVTFDMVPTKE